MTKKNPSDSPMAASVRGFHNHVLALEKATAPVGKMLGTSTESPFTKAVNGFITDQIKVLETEFNIPGWLTWWGFTCDFGRHPKNAQGIGGDGLPARTIRSVDGFIKLLEEKLVNAKAPTHPAPRSKALQQFQKRMVVLEDVMETLRKPLGMEPEAPLNQAVYGIVHDHCLALERNYDLGELLEWWWLECQLGENPMEAGVHGEDSMHPIQSIDDLIQLLDDRDPPESTEQPSSDNMPAAEATEPLTP